MSRTAQSPGRRVLSVEDVRNGPPTVDVGSAAPLVGVSRSYGYELARRGEFPCKTIKVGTRYRVLRTALLELLGEAG